MVKPCYSTMRFARSDKLATLILKKKKNKNEKKNKKTKKKERKTDRGFCEPSIKFA